MPKLNPYTESIKEYARSISALTGMEYETVHKVLKSLELVMLHELYEKGCENEESGTIKTDWISLPIPLIGNLWLYPINRNCKDETTNDGYTFKSTISMEKHMLNMIKTAYYGHHDYLRDEVVENFKDLLAKEFKSLI